MIKVHRVIVASYVSHKQESISKLGISLTQISTILTNQSLSHFEAFQISRIKDNNPAHWMQSINLYILLDLSFIEVEYFFSVWNLAHLTVDAMKNELNLDIFLVVVSHYAFEVVLFIAKVTHYSEVSHHSEGPFEPQVAHLHVQVYFFCYYT